jgi:hypothetical protein
MDRQARTGDTVLVKSREMTGGGKSQTLPWWLGGGGVKTTENKIHWPRWSIVAHTVLDRKGNAEGGGGDETNDVGEYGGKYEIKVVTRSFKTES